MVKAAVGIAMLGAMVGGGLNAQSVSVSAGNIVYRAADGVSRALTAGGRDTMPALSPDGHWVAFIRRTPGDTVNTALGWQGRTELWLARVDGAHARRLLRGREASAPESALANLHDPVFSTDGRTVYLGSTGWVTSDALHAVETQSGQERFVCAANTFELLRLGPYRGDLLVGQHRYSTSGSYDGSWIVSPRGRIIGLVAMESDPDEEAKIDAVRAGKIVDAARPQN